MFKMNKNGNYLIAVSGGPDSMALLDMMYKKGLSISCAHVNYHKRKTALRDEKIVRDYCRKRNIKFYKFDVKEYHGNFQDYARVERYKFFSSIIRKNNLDALLVAHHMDDLIETYLMQMERGSIPNCYGLNSKVLLQGVTVYRPLLRYTKKQLENYCINNDISYGIDESNLTDHYKRNKIRHAVVEKMSIDDKKKLVKEINEKNKEIDNKRKQIKEFIKKRKQIPINEYKNFKYKDDLIRYLVKEDLSQKHINDIKKQIGSSKNVVISLKEQYLVKEYGYIEICDKNIDYEVQLDKLVFKRYDCFKTSKKGTSFEGVTVSKSDFPLTIRNFRNGDSIKMRYGTKKINRFFIDQKISFSDRMIWPVVLNEKGVLILVPGIGCDKDHYSIKHNLYVIKFNMMEK